MAEMQKAETPYENMKRSKRNESELITPDSSFLDEMVTDEEKRHMTTAITKPQEEPGLYKLTETPVPTTPMDLLNVALSNNAAIDVIERLAALQRDMLQREAEIEFNEAMNRAQQEIRRIAPDAENPQTRSKYASYAAIDRVIRPIYAKEGFSLSFSTEECPLPEHVRCVCFVSLRAHTRKYQVDMPSDGKGAKGGDVMTKTHACGAAMQYGMRYLVKYIWNIAVGEDDTDGVTSSQEADFLLNIESATNLDELKRNHREAAQVAIANKDMKALKLFTDAKDKRKAELQEAQ